jgi:hypothetical protein
MNNDVLIPRSILKKALAGGNKEKRAQIAAEDSFRNHIMEIITAGDSGQPMLGIEDHTEEDEFLHKDEAVMGKRLHKDHMLLSPKLRDLIQSFDQYKPGQQPPFTQKLNTSLPNSPKSGDDENRDPMAAAIE